MRCSPLGSERLGFGITDTHRQHSGGVGRHRRQWREVTTRLHEKGCGGSWRHAHRWIALRRGVRVTGARQGTDLGEETPNKWGAQGGGHLPVDHLTCGTYLSATGRG
jgi:hypothetical protein